VQVLVGLEAESADVDLAERAVLELLIRGQVELLKDALLKERLLDEGELVAEHGAVAVEPSFLGEARVMAEVALTDAELAHAKVFRREAVKADELLLQRGLIPTAEEAAGAVGVPVYFAL